MRVITLQEKNERAKLCRPVPEAPLPDEGQTIDQSMPFGTSPMQAPVPLVSLLLLGGTRPRGLDRQRTEAGLVAKDR